MKSLRHDPPFFTPPGGSYLTAVSVGATSATGAAAALILFFAHLGVEPSAGPTALALAVSVAAYIAGFVVARRIAHALGKRSSGSGKPESESFPRSRSVDRLHLGKTLLTVLTVPLFLALFVELEPGVDMGDMATAKRADDTAILRDGFREHDEQSTGVGRVRYSVGDVLQVALILALLGHFSMIVLSRLPALQRTPGCARSDNTDGTGEP